ncbi:MAG: glycosyltransferase [Paludibacteraceae bacterium]|nr:glycosyltransferase [Paludibacteraceae bacterium]
MLSILIPTYNYDCQPLIDALNIQAQSLNVVYEIIVLNDASTVPFSFTGCATINMERNVGRAAGRNILAKTARYPYLLFIDSDSLPARTDYLESFVRIINRNPSPLVVSGGRVYRPATDVAHSLLPAYGIRERVTTEGTSDAPFMSPNFLIDRETFLSTLFDESFKGYGHEDTVFGISLLRKGIRYRVTDNPVVHCHIESNAEFLRKNREALRTLHSLAHSGSYPELRHISRMVRHASRLPLRLPPSLSLIVGRILLRHPRPWLLQIYKYLYYCTL